MRATRLKHGEFYADIVADRFDPDTLWIYVVQRHGSAEILAMGSCHSEDDAAQNALRAIAELRGKSASAR